jgi:hypothetical protein
MHCWCAQLPLLMLLMLLAELLVLLVVLFVGATSSLGPTLQAEGLAGPSEPIPTSAASPGSITLWSLLLLLLGRHAAVAATAQWGRRPFPLALLRPLLLRRVLLPLLLLPLQWLRVECLQARFC